MSSSWKSTAPQSAGWTLQCWNGRDWRRWQLANVPWTPTCTHNTGAFPTSPRAKLYRPRSLAGALVTLGGLKFLDSRTRAAGASGGSVFADSPRAAQWRLRRRCWPCASARCWRSPRPHMPASITTRAWRTGKPSWRTSRQVCSRAFKVPACASVWTWSDPRLARGKIYRLPQATCSAHDWEVALERWPCRLQPLRCGTVGCAWL